MRNRLSKSNFLLFCPTRAKTRENGAFYGSRPAGNAWKINGFQRFGQTNENLSLSIFFSDQSTIRLSFRLCSRMSVLPLRLRISVYSFHHRWSSSLRLHPPQGKSCNWKGIIPVRIFEIEIRPWKQMEKRKALCRQVGFFSQFSRCGLFKCFPNSIAPPGIPQVYASERRFNRFLLSFGITTVAPTQSIGASPIHFLISLM